MAKKSGRGKRKKHSKLYRDINRAKRAYGKWNRKHGIGKSFYESATGQQWLEDKEKIIKYIEGFNSVSAIEDLGEIITQWAIDLGLIADDGDKAKDKAKAFETAKEMAEEAFEGDADEELDYDYNSEVYHSPNTEAQNEINDWWSKVRENYVSPRATWERLPASVYSELKTWKEETIKLIGEENFADLLKNRMSYHAECRHGTVDFVEFFTTLYDEDEKRPETLGETTSRISFWIRLATDEAMYYIPEDQDIGSYDEITADLLNRMENYY